MTKIKPISPKEITDDMENIIPAVVISTVNKMLKKEYRNGQAILQQSKIITAILNSDKSMTRISLFENNWMDFESIYRKAGWKVVYDKPAYNETYEATFTFSKK